MLLHARLFGTKTQSSYIAQLIIIIIALSYSSYFDLCNIENITSVCLSNHVFVKLKLLLLLLLSFKLMLLLLLSVMKMLLL